MPSRAWLAIVAAGWLAAPLALAQDAVGPALENEPGPQPEQESNEHPAPEQQQPADLVPAIRNIEAAIRDLIPDIDQTERATQVQREQADLRAQQDMAFWAAGMFWATCAAVLLTLVGIILIWRTLRYTRDAAETTKLMLKEAGITSIAADKTAKAAERQIDASREAMIASHRGWMEVEAVTLESGLEKTDEGFRLKICAKCRNIGMSPALNCTITISAEPCMSPIGVPIAGLHIPDKTPIQRNYGTAVFPKRHLKTCYVNLLSHRDIKNTTAKYNSDFSDCELDHFRFIAISVHCRYSTAMDVEGRQTIFQTIIGRGESDVLITQKWLPIMATDSSISAAELHMCTHPHDLNCHAY